jgi:molybdopterin molybdotransferase
MLSPQQALKRVQAAAALRRLPVQRVPVAQAAGRVLARDLRSRADYPAFDNSAMDGFAVRSREKGPWRVQGSSFAGSRPLRLKPGCALRVATGGPLPAGADAVIPKELATLQDGALHAPRPGRGDHVRRRGEDFRRGQALLKAGTRLDPGALALTAAAGWGALPCRRLPRVGLLVGGSELSPAGARLRPGAIYDSNGPMLAAALPFPLRMRRAKDNPAAFARALRALGAHCDVLLVSGGVSAGEKDFSKSVLERLGVRRVFWKVAQKPGKPLYFGLWGRRLVFGLPGNPAAALACLTLYVLPALAAVQDARAAPPARLPLAQALKGEARWLFLRGQAGEKGLRILKGQGSHQLRSLAGGTHLVEVPPASNLRRGQPVRAWPLPLAGGQA